MARVYVSVGSNVAAEHNIRSCLQKLRERFGVLLISPVYRSRAEGFAGADFLNLVVGFDSDAEPQPIAGALRQIETAHGRRRDGPRFSDRPLDLDLLLYDDRVLDEPGLQVPRDEITRYAFVLKPLADLAGEQHHPQLGRTFADLWQAFAAGWEEALIPVRLDGLPGCSGAP